ncbi:MAG: hypothetical protein O3C69_00275 [Chloroflexi bacterium]|nr:hypothetical protein [Chloroflexota bacterium]
MGLHSTIRKMETSRPDMAAERARTGVSGRIAIRLNIPPEPLPERPAARA